MYTWVVFLHIVGAFTFTFSHGSSANVAFKLRHERNLDRIRALLDLSSSYFSVLSGSLLLLLVAGVIVGFLGHWWNQGWIWLSLGLLILINVAMYLIGSQHYSWLRKAVGLHYFEKGNSQTPVEPSNQQEVEKLVISSRPEFVTLIGFGGLLLIVWLMIFNVSSG